MWLLTLVISVSSDCNPLCPTYAVFFMQQGDKTCDSECNTGPCSFDGGDCQQPPNTP